MTGTSSYKYVIVFLCFICCLASKAQQLSFQQVSVKNGLSSFTLSANIFDDHGFLWIGTNDGLNKYDGYSITQYLKETHPQLPSNEIGSLFCDSRNRIWICTNSGLAMLDESRTMRKIILHDSLPILNVDICFEVASGMIVTTKKGIYYLKEGTAQWKPHNWLNTVFTNTNVLRVSFLGKDTALFVAVGEKITVLDFKRQKVLLDYKFKDVFAADFINNREILAGSNGDFDLRRIDISSGNMIQTYTTVLNRQNEKIQAGVYFIKQADEKNMYISTIRNGLLKFTPSTNAFENYMHVAMDENTIASNSPRWISVADNGNLAISTNRGLSLTNMNYTMMDVVPFFITPDGKIIDDEVYNVVETSNKKLWVATLGHLLCMDMITKETAVIRDIRKDIEQKINYPRPSALETDNNDNVWAAFAGEGISVYSNTGKLVKRSIPLPGLPINDIRVLKRLPDGNIMVGTNDRLFTINSKNYSIDTFANDAPLQKIAHQRIIDIMINGDELWIAASPRGGAYCYNFKTKKFKAYTPANGLLNDRVYGLEKDRLGNIYMSGFGGLSILSPDGKITNFEKVNGQRIARIENILTDDSGYVWLTYNTNISRYNPYNRSFDYFDEHNGLNILSYVIASGYKTKDGKLMFGNRRGMVSFDPREMKLYTKPVKLVIHSAGDGKDILAGDNISKLQYAYNEGKINFSISTSDLLSNKKIVYSYKMTGLDTGWSPPTFNRNITYNLNPGKYVFAVRASYNGKDWIATSDNIEIHVAYPFWQKAWFIILVALVLIAAALLFYKNRIRSVKNKAAIKQQITEIEAKALRAQMNPHFIFNSLNAIQELIITENADQGYRYLSSFSKLLRMVLNNSEKNFIPLSSELEMIKLYLSLEALRFRQSFTYDILVDEKIEQDIVQVPSLLFQPYVENAVWHGLRHKEGEKKIMISIKETGNQLQIKIDDNGIGRKQSAIIKKQKLGAEQFDSKGSVLAQQRIDILNQQFPDMAKTEIIDKKDEAGDPCGTTIILSLPIHVQLN